MCKMSGVQWFVLQLQLLLLVLPNVFAVRGDVNSLPPTDHLTAFVSGITPARMCRNHIKRIQPLNFSIVLQPSLFNLDSGREVQQMRRLHLLPREMQVNDKLLRTKFAEAGLYMNGKLVRAQLLAADENHEVYPLSPRKDNETEFGFAVRREPSLRVDLVNGIKNASPI